MPCRPIIDKNAKFIGISCSRGRRSREKCAFCGKSAVGYCDTCDKPVCNEHKHSVSKSLDTDVCPECNTPKGRETAKKRRSELEQGGL